MTQILSLSIWWSKLQCCSILQHPGLLWTVKVVTSGLVVHMTDWTLPVLRDLSSCGQVGSDIVEIIRILIPSSIHSFIHSFQLGQHVISSVYLPFKLVSFAVIVEKIVAKIF